MFFWAVIGVPFNFTFRSASAKVPEPDQYKNAACIFALAFKLSNALDCVKIVHGAPVPFGPLFMVLPIIKKS